MSNNIENLHIKELTIDNYKSLKNSKIELKSGLNIIIGKNGAGKSNLLEFIDAYSKAAKFDMSIIPFRKTEYYSDFAVTMQYEIENITHLFSYSVSLLPNLNNEIADPNVDLVYKYVFNKSNGIHKTIENKTLIATNRGLITDVLNKEVVLDNELDCIVVEKIAYIESKLPDDIDSHWLVVPSSSFIDYDGLINNEEYSAYNFFAELSSNFHFLFLPNLTDEIRDDLDLFRESLIEFVNDYFDNKNLNNLLKTLSPIQKIRINACVNVSQKEDSIFIENLFIEFLIGNDWLPWSYLSDGTKRLFYIITECISIENGIILVEEPELGIHPHQLFKLMDFLKEQSRTKQVIITTHSPMVLDILNENELDRITIAEYDKETKFLKLNEEQISKAKEYINEVGELSYYWLHSDLEK